MLVLLGKLLQNLQVRFHLLIKHLYRQQLQYHRQHLEQTSQILTLIRQNQVQWLHPVNHLDLRYLLQVNLRLDLKQSHLQGLQSEVQLHLFASQVSGLYQTLPYPKTPQDPQQQPLRPIPLQSLLQVLWFALGMPAQTQ